MPKCITKYINPYKKATSKRKTFAGRPVWEQKRPSIQRSPCQEELDGDQRVIHQQ